jgi:hypothetical protein
MRYQRVFLFLLAGAVAWPLTGETNRTTAVKRRDATETKSRAPVAGTRNSAPGISESRKSRSVETYGNALRSK